ncbi:keratinocyte differentiation factor 1 [Paramormyrops kingsleyae]|uniref:Keratinocyte differentiation factor 1a n=1 Tax=Paramormyrops kingsleyae TaxID=1676925 RepID=A0A3B3SZ85_9TELE|nr:keratinocyte differentiation factor 1-like isoform X1 [Paramormyrops kingsleyae]XP_023667208.1 keratinocyte differentiation factor 1-like isoform X1 [Paramormyrops kingsleyae]XP_023667218.1 keratinocyte differentiation factor 1-like isoform X1 [Paramormyrops kingsleyae]XP_023667224.1 keratinocyte differentiation factor 1-like isoform X1 [Paramormyrops kingsleyae]XP_023667231.1 keratinocyte differentiation factor 1-like isoform X1 [Paramormyrops kingsleyae]
MPGRSTRGPPNPRPHPRYVSRPETAGYRQAPLYYKDGKVARESQREPRVELPRPSNPRYPHKARPPIVNGCGAETLGFVPGSADSAVPPPPCGPCGSLSGWSGCLAFVCCMLTCGLYGAPKPCRTTDESSTDPEPGVGTATTSSGKRDPEMYASNFTSNGLSLSNPTCGVSLEPPSKSVKLPAFDSFSYRDVRIGGQKVRYPDGPSASRRARPPGATPKGETPRPISNTSIYSREDLYLDDPSDSGTDIDTLIQRKLLELYKMHQIEQLAQCTSDSSFSRRTNEISDLINSIAQDYNLQEQEAECRLVQGVIRISTRKNKVLRDRDPAPQEAWSRVNGRRDKTISDSGHDTMTDTFNSNDTEPEVKVSEQTQSDELARKLRHSGRAASSTSPLASPHHQEMDTDSSGAPLLRFHRT